ncbi:MAG: copper resistance protein CopC [Candidatus Dormibacter sp.]
MAGVTTLARFAAGLVLTGGALLALTVTADAHSLVRFSDPPDGATLAHAPKVVIITFTETPDPTLSRVEILDTAGHQVAGGLVSGVRGSPTAVSVPVPALSDGVYTVSWRTVSAIDGHVATGVFAFAIGTQAVPPIPLTVAAPAAPPSPLGVTGRWGLDAGYGLLLGGAWVELLALEDISLAVLLLVGVGDALALAGALMVAEAARENAGVDWSIFLGTSLAHGMELVVAPIVGAGLAVFAAWRLRGTGRRVALALCAVLSLVAMLANALASHAAASPLAWLMIPAHWLHVASYAVWIGGLAAVLVGIRGLPTIAKAEAVGRFSLVAGIAFAAMILTGLVRGIDEVGSWSNLFTTTFGWLLLLKTALFLTITPLAATNRWRYVRIGVAGIKRLRWVSRGELMLAAGIMVAAAFLTTLPPPSFVRPVAARNFPHVVVTGVDYGGAVRVTLDVAPGYPGLNRFTVTVRDNRGAHPVANATLFLLFDLPARPEIGESELELRQVTDGLYTAESTRLSLAGTWTVTVVVETAITSYDAVLSVRTAGAP